jgi:hypothetical protein
LQRPKTEYPASIRAFIPVLLISNHGYLVEHFLKITGDGNAPDGLDSFTVFAHKKQKGVRTYIPH